MKSFSDNVLNWFDQQGRKNLPWQKDINPYRVWVSEIMLQQTQVKTVIPYYQRFMQSFPNVEALASATQDDVLKHWSGLGYYARGRNLHKSAQQVCEEFAGEFPKTLDEMQRLPGIGRSTAAAILSIAHNQQHAILDGNVKRVIARVFAVSGWPGHSAVVKKLWALADELVPKTCNADYTQAMMDLGATVCTRSKPACDNCPLNADCLALKQGNIADYPGKKPKKALPQKKTIMLMLKTEQGEILMIKRPPLGIWGGLWCFPQFDEHKQADNWLLENYQSALAEASALDSFQHVFSHFKLTIHPFLLNLKTDNQTPLKLGVMEADEQLWYNINTEFNGGLAAPVKTLLNQIKE